MFVAPKNLKTNRLLKNRTINFDTPKRIEGNLVFILTDDRDVFYNVLKSPLLRPQQMRCAYSPRIIRPLKRTPVRYDIANLFAEIKEKSNGKIMICKTMPTLYNGKNLAYDVTNEYKEVSRVAFATRSGKVASDMVRDAMRNSIIAHAKEVGYEKNYLIVPMDKYIDVNSIGQAVRQVGFTEPIPAILLLKDLINGHIQDYSIFERIFFYNTEADVMLVIDPNSDETLKYLPDTFAKLNRMNKFAGKRDGETLTDDVEGAEAEDISDEDYTETLKQQIKDEVLKRVAKQLKAKNLTDFEEATKEEKVLALSIDNKIDEYLAKPDNVRRPFNDLVNEIDSDADVKSKAIAYVESKRSAAVKAATLSKALEKELAAIDKVSDIDVSEENITPMDFGVDDKLDPSIAKSTLPAMDQEYNNKFLKNDLNNVFESFSQSSYYPSAIEDITYEDTSDDFNKKETASIRYKVDDGQTISFKLDIPTIVDDHYFYVGGNKYTIGKQMIRLPIVKTKSDRVEITASYQKMTIERRGSKVSRRNAYLMKVLKAYDNPKVKVTQGDNSLINSSYKSDFEYEELSASLSKIESINITVIFNRQIMQEMIDATDLPENFIKDDMTPFAYDNADENYGIYYIKDVKVYHAITENNEVKIEEISSNMFDFLLKKVLFLDINKLPSIGKSFIYTTVKFLTVTFPVFTLVGLMNGISDILQRHKVVYQISEKKMIGDSRWVEVKFKDKYLYYEDKLENTLLLNALYIMDTEKYDYEDFDTNVPYLAYLTEKLGQPMYAEGMLKINLDKMIDPITREILVELHQPTNIIDLLLLANNMLVNNSYQPLNDLKNYRIRGNEIVAAVAYGIVANAYKNYQQYKLNGRPESIKVGRTELINSLIGLQNINTTSMLNPIQEIENSYACSAKGYKGINLGKAYNLEMRTYDDSMIGYLSGNSTAYSGAVGISRGLVFSPNISSVRGYVGNSDINQASATSLLSIAEMLSPFTASQADAPRAAMQVAQTKHTMPVAVMNKQLFGSGANKELAYMISDDFCFKAKKDGVVEDIDRDTKLAILLYDDGSRDAIDLNETLVKNSNSGFFVKQTFLIVYNVGERFKSKDVIAYNPSFFTGKGRDIDYCPGTLAKVALTAGDFAFEDATVISESLADRCAANVTICKAVSLDPNTIIHMIKNVGDDVESGEHLMEFTTNESEISANLIQGLYSKLDDDLFKQMTYDTIKSKYSGKIVDIKIYYNHDFEELNPSLQNLISNYKANIEKRKEKLRKLGIRGSAMKLPPTDKQTNTKIEGTEYDGVLVCFYIEYSDKMGVGDKLTFQTALKGVISKVFANEEAPTTEYRSEDPIEAICTPTGIISRMTSDIYSTLYVNKVLVELGKQIKEIWNK